MKTKTLTHAQILIKNRSYGKNMPVFLKFQDHYSEYDDSNFEYSESFSWEEDYSI